MDSSRMSHIISPKSITSNVKRSLLAVREQFRLQLLAFLLRLLIKCKLVEKSTAIMDDSNLIMKFLSPREPNSMDGSLYSENCI